MSNYNNLKSSINNNIYENQTQQITGTVLNAILNEMTNALGAGYQFAGVATVGMTPSEPDARIFYLAGEGIYTSFDGIQVPAGKLGILKWDNRWHLETIDGLGSGGANLTGYVTVASTDDLPDEGVATLGYLCGENLYLYVGEGGDTKEGKYQDCGSFRGPQGDSVQDVEQTQTSLENGGVNKIKFTLSNGISCEFQVRNGTTSSGLFPTLEALQAAYPSPVVGQYAFVGAGFPADIYVCTTAGTWTDSGEDYDGDNVDLTDYATKAEVNQLEAEMTNLSGKYYGVFDDDSDLPDDADRIGYAYVGIEEPLSLFNFDGVEWTDTNIKIYGLIGPPGPQGTAGQPGEQGIQGPPGLTSVEATVDNNEGIPSVEASINNGVLALSFHNLKGLQGNTGSSVSYPFTLVNNTTTNDATQALTAAMGKLLQDQINALIIDNDFADEDIVIADENEYALVAFGGGNIRTKNFDSSKVRIESGDTLDDDFDIRDEVGNRVVLFSNGHIKTKKFDSSLVGQSHWNGKMWMGFGTSITNTNNEGKYPPYLVQLSGLIFLNHGHSGGGVTTSSNQAVYTDIMSADFSGMDLITLEVGANDEAAPLGTIYDGLPDSAVQDNSTFCGALNILIRHLQANSDAQVVVMCSPTARYQYGHPENKYDGNETYGTDNHTIFDRNEAIRKVCQLNSCWYIPAFSMDGMGFARMNASNDYNTDQVHQTNLGGYNFAQAIWAFLKNIPLFYTSIN